MQLFNVFLFRSTDFYCDSSELKVAAGGNDDVTLPLVQKQSEVVFVSLLLHLY